MKLGISLCLLALFAPTTRAAETKPAWSDTLSSFFAEPRFEGALWGVKVVSLATGETVFEHEPNLRLSPASNCKLYVGALALDRLGGDYRIETPILATATVAADGHLAGDLVIAGRGDPSWAARFKKKSFASAFEPIIAALTQAGVKRISGDIVADATWLRSPPHGPGWVVEDMGDYYSAEISAITLADNYVEFNVTPGAAIGEPCKIEFAEPLSALTFVNRTQTLPAGKENTLNTRRLPGSREVEITGGVALGGKMETTESTVPRPAQWFATALRDALQQAGIVVDGTARSLVWPEKTPRADVKLGRIVSPPLRELVADFMQPSQNLETDLIFAHLGEISRTAATPPDTRSDDLALDRLNEFLREIGIPKSAVIFDEGSGLSRNNLATADATVKLLRHLATHREADAFAAALPLAGRPGTLRNRLKGTPLEGKMQAKTGSLRWATALSGYLTDAHGEKLAFSLMLNRYVAPAGRKASQEIDEAALALAGYAAGKK
ncbi:D-alanyl-D-alanine carboxypeptidase/D-alanyl-D-alanine endopeptidase [Oleiharenicola lentus]|uniref:D-alanyl-D-alanine carboxypeptidase/D-alanyl-D-alanine endopeptidase n=1 Tax=Oleiharenicola lentus TaxID=2508720 RepID=UPI003F67B059